jgi:iron complex transport system permease protein
MLITTAFIAIAVGAVPISFNEMSNAIQHWMKHQAYGSIYEGVFIQIRLPRIMLCGIAGAILAVSGVLMQGLFRNPIVEPGLTGTSAGAAFGASIVFVISAGFSAELQNIIGIFILPLFAFIGGLMATYLVYTLSRKSQQSSITAILLTGIAVNAIALSGIGLMSYIARDPQARSITFWNLGTFTGASWIQVFIVGIIGIICLFFSFRFAKDLNILQLGDDEAGYIGLNSNQLKKRILLLNTIAVSVVTAFTGVIGFVGLIVPHIMRMIIGSNHKKLIPFSMIAGAIFLLLADLMARTIAAPAELPIGIITSIIGAPLFILLLKKIGIINQTGINND